MHKNRSATPFARNKAERFLAAVFVRGGCFRTPDWERRKRQGQRYKKGYEVRLPAADEEELSRLRRCLRSLGIKPAKPYAKYRQVVQMVYGKRAVAAVAKLLAHAGVKSPKLIDPAIIP